MIANINYLKKICTDITKVENYKIAIDDKKRYIMHHRLETHFSDGMMRPKNSFISMNELKALGMYQNRPPEEFVFLQHSQHSSLHSAGEANCCYGLHRFGKSSPNYGKPCTKETKHKISIANSCKYRIFYTQEMIQDAKVMKQLEWMAKYKHGNGAYRRAKHMQVYKK